MKSEGLLPYSQDPITRPYPEPDESSPQQSTSYSFKFYFNFITPSTLSSSKWSPTFRFLD
jgi:hypothetical protein